MATATHLVMLARMPDQDRHDSVRLSRCWQEEGGPISDEGGVVSILQKVDLSRDRVEAVAQMGTALGD